MKLTALVLLLVISKIGFAIHKTDSGAYINELTDELILSILENLDPIEKARLAQTNNRIQIILNKNLDQLILTKNDQAPEIKFSGLIIDIVAWSILNPKLTSQLLYKNAEMARIQAGIELQSEVYEHVKELIGSDLMYHFWCKVWAKIRDQINLQIDDKSESQLIDELKGKEISQEEIDFVFTVFRQNIVNMALSEEYRAIQSYLADFVSKKMTADQILEFFRRLNMPEKHKYWFAEAQLTLLRRNLPRSN